MGVSRVGKEESASFVSRSICFEHRFEKKRSEKIKNVQVHTEKIVIIDIIKKVVLVV